MRHTKGPWKVIEASVFAGDGYEIADCSGAHLHKDYDSDRGHWAGIPGSHRDISETEEEANARLIAKSPDMLLALREFLEWGSMTSSDRDLFEQKFKLIIAEVEGGG